MTTNSAAPLDPMDEDEIITFRARIAHALGRSKRTISRSIRSGLLSATTNGPDENNLMQVRAADLEKPKTYSDSAASDA